MTLPQNVKDAVKLMDGCISTLPKGNKRDWQTIRAHLMSQDAEIERYKIAWTEYNDRTEWVQKTAKPKELGLHRADVLRLRIESAESRLAAADALLREISDRTATGTDFRDLAARIRAHLSENTDVQP